MILQCIICVLTIRNGQVEHSTYNALTLWLFRRGGPLTVAESR